MSNVQNYEFASFAVAKGKGVTQADKVAQHVKNGAEVGALIGAGIGRKATIDAMVADGMGKTVHALSAGNIRPAVALVVAKSGHAVSILEENGKAPYSEWLRLGATLAQMPQQTKACKPTAASKALQLHTQLSEQAAAIRAAREAQKSIANSEV